MQAVSEVPRSVCLCLALASRTHWQEIRGEGIQGISLFAPAMPLTAVGSF